MKTRSILAIAIALSLAGTGDAEAGYKKQALVLAKVLSYESTLERRAGTELDIVVLYRAGDADSEAEARGWGGALRAMHATRVHGLAIRVLETSSLADAARFADVVIICSGLEHQASEIRSAARRGRFLTVGAAREQVVDGMAVGVFLHQGKPKIVVNLPETRRESVKFSSSLLRLAEVLR